jgi:adenosylcobinamide kinase / adenosylcobinamide-phosphate guanylyltransferase
MSGLPLPAPPPPPSAVPAGITLILGGARSGKSSFAVELGRRHGGGVTMIATATATDEDMATRIERHRAERPGWDTIEEPLELGGALQRVPADHLALVDCLTLWVSNLMFAEHVEAAILDRAAAAAAIAARRMSPTIVISNEVGLGVHPPSELGRRYQDALGRVNQIWAAAADRTLLLVAGRAVVLRDPWDVLTWT